MLTEVLSWLKRSEIDFSKNVGLEKVRNLTIFEIHVLKGLELYHSRTDSKPITFGQTTRD